MKGLAVFRWLMPVALAVFLSVPVQTANAHGMGGGGGHMGGGMGGGHMGGMGGRGRPMMGGRFVGHGGRFRGSHFFFRNRFFAQRNFFFRHNFFVGFDLAAFGWWPGWWGGWDWDSWYPYPDYPYYPYYDYGNPYDNGSYGDQQTNDSQYSAEYWNNLAKSVQTKLVQQGYYRGQVDGVIGSGTMEAVRRFQADHRLKVTGKIDPKLLKALGISYKAPPRAQA